MNCKKCGREFWSLPSQVNYTLFCSNECKHDPPLVRLFKNITTNRNGCQLFGGSIIAEGYGVIKFKGRNWRAHRLSWFLQKGEIPTGFGILHTCIDTPSCINVEHLYPGTAQDNTNDRMRQGRHRVLVGEEHPFAELTVEQVIQIKKLKDVQGLVETTFQFGLKSVTTVWNIWNGKTWKHVDAGSALA